MVGLTLDILRYLFWPNPQMKERPTYWAIAKALNTPPSTVKRHLDHLSSDGILKGISAVPDLYPLRLIRSVVMARMTPRVSDKLIENLDVLDSVLCVCKSNDSIGLIDLIHSGDPSHEIEFLKRLCGHFTVMSVHSYRSESPDRLTFSELRVAGELRHNPMIRLSDLTEHLGISKAAVRRILTKFRDNRLVTFVPVLNSYHISNGVMFLGILPVGEEDKPLVTQRINEIGSNDLIALQSKFDGVIFANLYANDFAELVRIREEIEDIPQIRSAHFLFPYELMVNHNTIVDNIARSSSESIARLMTAIR